MFSFASCIVPNPHLAKTEALAPACLPLELYSSTFFMLALPQGVTSPVPHQCPGCREPRIQGLAKGGSFIPPMLLPCLSCGGYRWGRVV